MGAAVDKAFVAFLETGIAGALCVILMGVVVFLYRARNADVAEEREAHEETRNAHLNDLRSVSNLAEQVRIQLASTEATIRLLLDRTKEGK